MLVKNTFGRGMAVFLISVLAGQIAAQAEPWLDTRDAWLRADIERLSQAGIIKVPINTWPLMWASIMNDLEVADIKNTPMRLQGSLSRLLSAGREATRANKSHQSIKLSAATDSQAFRHFGDDSREAGEFTVRRSGLTRHLAYNLEVTHAIDPWDGEKTHYDNSYFGFVMGNWVGLVGNIEKWWGPGWNSSIMLSNNARPTPGFTLHRNYSDPFELPVLKWLGPWTTSMFISKLDDERFIDNAKLVGLTLGFRPTPSLEINLRRTAQWGGEGRPEGFKSFIELVTGIADNCDTAECRPEEPGNQLGAIDISWNIPWVEGSLYVQSTGEDEAGALPSRSSRQYGFKQELDTQYFNGMVFIEHDNTSTVTYSQQYNILYNHSIYQTGYRYQGRVIGATWDNDSKVFSVGTTGYLRNGDQLELRYSKGDINRDSLNTGSATKHSVTSTGADFTSLMGKWQRPFYWGEIQIQGRYMDKVVEAFGRQEDKLRVSASVTYRFD